MTIIPVRMGACLGDSPLVVLFAYYANSTVGCVVCPLVATTMMMMMDFKTMWTEMPNNKAKIDFLVQPTYL
eukprot:scaffold258654_cov35-Attheya_sp.AAC.1